MRTAAGCLIAVMVALLAGCGQGARTVIRAPATTPDTTPHTTAPTTAPPADVIAWLDDPYPTEHELKPLPTTPPPRTAPACTVHELAIAGTAPPGDTQDDGVIVQIRNTSKHSCRLEGKVHATLYGPGVAPVHIVGSGPLRDKVWGSYDMKPGDLTDAWFYATGGCMSGPAKGLEAVPVTSLAIAVPSGGSIRVTGLNLPRTCHGPVVGAFMQRLPAPEYPPEPLAGAKFYLEVPGPVRAGSVLHFVVRVVNPGDKAITMTPCPSYTVGLTAGTPGKAIFGLNCDGHARLLPHESLRFAMQLSVPADAPPGPAKLDWELEGPNYPLARVPVTVAG